MAGIPRLRDYQRACASVLRLSPLLPVRLALCRACSAGLAAGFSGQIELASAFAPRDWHVHEMLYGFVPAVVTGFLLTAIPNWTGRLPLQGMPLLTLLAVWIAGRAAVDAVGRHRLDRGGRDRRRVPAAGRRRRGARNCCGTELAQSESRRARSSCSAAGNIAFHLEAHFRGSADYSRAGSALRPSSC